jgi:hypothetical protein
VLRVQLVPGRALVKVVDLILEQLLAAAIPGKERAPLRRNSVNVDAGRRYLLQPCLR